MPLLLALVTMTAGVTQVDARLQTTLDSSRAAIEAPGASAAVILADGRVWTGVSGIAAPDQPVTAATVFELGSVTKAYTAALALLLVEEGRLSLDARAAQWFPDVRNAEQITVRQLLNHTSGLYDPAQDPAYVPAMLAQPARAWTVSDLLARLKEPYHAPGQGWHYTSTGYHLVGEMLEVITGDSLPQLLRRRLLAPHGLARTYFGGREAVPEPRAHAFLDIDNDGALEDLSALLPGTAFLTAAGAAGALLSTAVDAARFMHALHGGRVLSAASHDELTRWVDRPDGNRHGLGVLRLNVDGLTLLGHKGNTAGFSAAVFHAPDAGVTVAVLTNRHATDVTPVVRALLAAVVQPD